MAVVWLIDLFGDYQSTNSKPLPPLSAQIVNPVFPQQPRRTKKKASVRMPLYSRGALVRQ